MSETPEEHVEPEFSKSAARAHRKAGQELIAAGHEHVDKAIFCTMGRPGLDTDEKRQMLAMCGAELGEAIQKLQEAQVEISKSLGEYNATAHIEEGVSQMQHVQTVEDLFGPQG